MDKQTVVIYLSNLYTEEYYSAIERKSYHLWQYAKLHKFSINAIMLNDPEGGNGNPLQYSCQEDSMDRGACWATVHGVTKSQTQLSACVCTHSHIHTHTK